METIKHNTIFVGKSFFPVDTHNNFGRLFLTITYLLNIPIWTHHFHIWVKIGYAIVVGIITALTGVNQWAAFRKNYKNASVVVMVDYIITFASNKLKKKKNRHYIPKGEKVIVTNQKPQNTDSNENFE